MATVLLVLQDMIVVIAAVLVATGGALLLAPAWFASRCYVLFGERAALRSAARSLDRTFYRHHRVLGSTIAFGATYILYFLVFHFSPLAVSDLLLSGIADVAIKPALVHLMQLLLFFGALLAFAVGLVLAVRPSALKPMETLVHKPLAMPGWRRWLAHETYGRMTGGVLMALGIGLWWLAGPR